MKKTKRNARLLAAIIFISGFAIGGATTVSIGLVKLRNMIRVQPGQESVAEKTAKRILSDLEAELDLDATIRAEIEQILNESTERMHLIRSETYQAVEKEMQRSTYEIAALLNKDEVNKFYDLIDWRYRRLGLEKPVRDL